MVTHNDCIKKWGQPDAETKQSYMTVWKVPIELRKGRMPLQIYCNTITVPLLEIAFKNLIERECWPEWKTYNGCYNVRKKRGGTTWSLHSWGIPIDINAADNAFGAKPTMSPEFVKCFIDAGFDWGGIWAKPDGMHFQPSKL